MERAVSGRGGGGSATVGRRQWRGEVLHHPPPADGLQARHGPTDENASAEYPPVFVSPRETGTAYRENRWGATLLAL